MNDWQDAGESLRQQLGIDGTAGDAQDVPHPYSDIDGAYPYCVVCGLPRTYRKHETR
jgi:hypothetical protein